MALVLSGGGARGDFEVGATRFLYDAGKRPNVISGASVGAINGIKLAEGEPQAEPAEGGYLQGLRGLEKIWLSDMTGPRQMFLEEDWLKTRRTLRKAVYGTPSRSEEWTSMDLIPTRLALKVFTGVLTALIRCGEFCTEVVGIQELMDGPNPPKALFNLSPIRKKLEDSRKLQLKRVKNSGIRLRLGVVGLESGKLRYVDESGALLGTDHAVNLIDAVMASASIPGMFPPVKLGDEWYVDGGVREPVPVQAAIEAGATEVFAVAASAPVAPSKTSFDNATLTDIAARSAMDIMTDETVQNELHPPVDWKVPVTVIRPTIDIHDITTVDPGLISITMAYGHMRAYDAVRGDQITAEQTDRIVTARKAIWGLEHQANGKSTPSEEWHPPLRQAPDPSAFLEIRKAKRELKKRLDQRLLNLGPTSLPAGTETWWLGWERHTWRPVAKSPWDRFEYRTTVQAEDAPYDSRVAVCSPAPDQDRMDVFMRGSDNACWYRSFDGNRWSEWSSLGGVFTGDPAAMAVGGVAWVFMRGTDNAIYYLWTHGPGQPNSGWQRVG